MTESSLAGSRSLVSVSSQSRGFASGWTADLLFSIAVFVALLAARREVVFDPPYQDQIYAWDEALFLAETNFNYYRLRFDEASSYGDRYARRSYMISFLPSTWAIFVKVTPSPRAAFACAHLLSLLSAALAANVIRRLSADIVGQSVAILAACAFITMPSVLFQIDMIGLYMPFTALMLASMEAQSRQKYRLAAWLGLASFLAKPMGLVVSAVLFAVNAAAALKRTDRVHRPWRWHGVTLSAALLVVEVLLLLLGGSPSHSRFVSPLLTWLNYGYLFRLCPDIPVICLVGWLVHALARRKVRPALFATPHAMVHPLELFARLRSPWLLLGLFLLATYPMPALPRYFVPLLALATVLLTSGLSALGINRALLASALLCWCAANIANSHGRFYVEPNQAFREKLSVLPIFDGSHCLFTERSLAYRGDHLRVVEAFRKIAEQFATFHLLAPEPYNRVTSSIEMGYVSRPMCSSVYDPMNIDLVQNEARQAHELLFMWCRESRLLQPLAGIDRLALENQEDEDFRFYHVFLPEQPTDSRAIAAWQLRRLTGSDWKVYRTAARCECLLKLGDRRGAAREVDLLKQGPLSTFERELIPAVVPR